MAQRRDQKENIKYFEVDENSRQKKILWFSPRAAITF